MDAKPGKSAQSISSSAPAWQSNACTNWEGELFDGGRGRAANKHPECRDMGLSTSTEQSSKPHGPSGIV